VFELFGASEIRSRLDVAGARGLTHFVGRDAEMDQLRKALNLTDAGHGQVVAVVGEPGVGKVGPLLGVCTLCLDKGLADPKVEFRLSR